MPSLHVSLDELNVEARFTFGVDPIVKKTSFPPSTRPCVSKPSSLLVAQLFSGQTADLALGVELEINEFPPVNNTN